MAQWTFRVSFAIPAVGTLWLVYYRTWKMPLASRTLNAAKKKVSVTGYDIESLKFAGKHFGGRLIATAGAVSFCAFSFGTLHCLRRPPHMLIDDSGSVTTSSSTATNSSKVNLLPSSHQVTNPS